VVTRRDIPSVRRPHGWRGKEDADWGSMDLEGFLERGGTDDSAFKIRRSLEKPPLV
jgi:hypothetical protein